jgi:hypothetical protein
MWGADEIGMQHGRLSCQADGRRRCVGERDVGRDARLPEDGRAQQLPGDDTLSPCEYLAWVVVDP